MMYNLKFGCDQLLKKLSTRKTIIVIYIIEIIFSVITILYSIGYRKEMIIFYILLAFLILFLVFKTNVIFDNKEKK